MSNAQIGEADGHRPHLSAVAGQAVAGQAIAGQAIAGQADGALAELREVALDVVRSALRAADPSAGVARLVSLEGDRLRVGDRTFDLAAYGSVVLLGAGKATMSIAEALESVLGDRLTRGLVVRRVGDPGALRRVEVIDADHPLPTEASVEAARRMQETAAGCGSGDLVITAFTGGSSALVCGPPDGVPFAAKQTLHALLLDSGASIEEINTVRKHISSIKGGRLAAMMPESTLVNLTVSDVVGDALDLICDPVVQDSSTAEGARSVLVHRGLWDVVTPEIRAHLASPGAESPDLTGRDITSHVLVTGSSVLTAMADRVRALGREPVALGSALEGEAVSLGGFLGTLARESVAHGSPFPAGSVLVGAGGEATVSISRRPGAAVGSGGPNQEVALGFARAVAGAGPVVGVFLDSDGVDGGTHAAGGCVDSQTVACARSLGLDLDGALERHDARSVLERVGDLHVTGPTGTNISDLIVIVLGEPSVPERVRA